MDFVSEATIERALAYVEAADYELLVNDFAEAQPVVLSYLLSDSSSVLTETERDYLLYLALVLWQSAERTTDQLLPIIDEETLGKAEEANYAQLEEVKSKDFRTRLNGFFEGTPQEDMLAFVEDALTEDADTEVDVTDTGREPIFVMLKSFVDALTQTV